MIDFKIKIPQEPIGIETIPYKNTLPNDQILVDDDQLLVMNVFTFHRILGFLHQGQEVDIYQGANVCYIKFQNFMYVCDVFICSKAMGVFAIS